MLQDLQGVRSAERELHCNNKLGLVSAGDEPAAVHNHLGET